MRFAQLHCFQHVQWRPGREELRRFAVAMFVGFVALGLMVAWRRHGLERSTWVLWFVGLALAVGGLTPGLGRWSYLGVHLPTALMGYIVSHILLTLMFLTVFTPLGVIVRLTGKDLLLLRRPRQQRLWISRSAVRDPDSYYRQF
jgi:saxitoxin biosynthesis operon SxtJ-like protein